MELRINRVRINRSRPVSCSDRNTYFLSLRSICKIALYKNVFRFARHNKMATGDIKKMFKKHTQWVNELCSAADDKDDGMMGGDVTWWWSQMFGNHHCSDNQMLYWMLDGASNICGQLWQMSSACVPRRVWQGRH